MAISSLDGFIASVKQTITWSRTASRTTIANSWFSIHDLAGNPGAATLSAGNTANGAVPTDATAGFPKVTFSSGLGYLAAVSFGATVAGRIMLYDRVFHAGAYSYVAATNTLTSQPSYVSRMPNSDYSNTQIWIEVETAFATGNAWTVTVTYTDQDGNGGATTGATSVFSAANLTKGRMFQMPLAAGDTGVSKIESVVVANPATSMTAGAFNVVVARPLWNGRIVFANDGDTHGFDRTAMPQVFGDSALTFAIDTDVASSGLIDNLITVVSG